MTEDRKPASVADADTVRCRVCGREFFSPSGRVPFHDPGDWACPGVDSVPSQSDWITPSGPIDKDPWP